jgi:AraC family transcriptional regulator
MKQELYKPRGSYLLRSQELVGFTLAEAMYPAQLRQPRHTHQRASFSFVLNGSYVENYGRQSQLRQPSTIVFHPPQESHSVDFESETVRILSVHIDFERLTYIREYSNVLDSPVSRRTEMIAWLGRRIYREFDRMDALSALAIEGLILEILVNASRDESGSGEQKSPRWLEQAKEFLHAHFSESLVLEDVAKAVGVHRVHLSRVFREKFGCTIGEYVRRLRVEFARREISATDLSFSEIALAAGFSDQSHLNKTFKSLSGFTPSEYRKTSRRY